jgi:hypothetical protein
MKCVLSPNLNHLVEVGLLENNAMMIITDATVRYDESELQPVRSLVHRVCSAYTPLT